MKGHINITVQVPLDDVKDIIRRAGFKYSKILRDEVIDSMQSNMVASMTCYNESYVRGLKETVEAYPQYYPVELLPIKEEE